RIGQPVWLLSGKKSRNKLRPIFGQLKERLIQQLDIEIAMTDVDDDGHCRFEGRHVGKVLLRSDTQINSAMLCCLYELRNDVLEAGFIGQQIVGTEEPVFFRGIFGQAPELFVGEFVRNRSRSSSDQKMTRSDRADD